MRKVTPPKENTIPKTIGGRIAYLRKIKKISQKNLAEQIGLNNREHLVMIEKNTRSPSIDTLKALSKELDTTTDFILCITHTPTTDMREKEVCEYTGLSEKSVKTLNGCLKSEKEYSHFKCRLEFINYILSSEYIYDLFTWLGLFDGSVTYCCVLEELFPDIDFLDSVDAPVLFDFGDNNDELKAQEDYKETVERIEFEKYKMTQIFSEIISKYENLLRERFNCDEYHKRLDDEAIFRKKVKDKTQTMLNELIDEELKKKED